MKDVLPRDEALRMNHPLGGGLGYPPGHGTG
eukprot:CAMPEP_0194392260 /NCGR_PEP_ID=MMETSP0174-20130528/120602_1 /TAXON_ID=216777 /ORGANISM="Proboscia alata, Strain PI-D3" /LENGTH=30 /DNA_ID= /DNA_START= /DNA_END= /DNA_ORIENTATION=